MKKFLLNIKESVMRIIFYLHPIRYDNFLEFLSIARTNSYIVTVKEIFIPLPSDNYPIAALPGATCWHKLRGHKKNNFDIICEIPFGYINFSNDKDNMFEKFRQKEELIRFTLKSFNILQRDE